MLLFTSFKPPLQRLQQLLRPAVRISPLFGATVLLPLALAVAYFGFIASDIFVSESRFVVRSQQRQPSAGVLGSILSGGGMSRAQDDAYSVQEFIASRDALARLDQKLGVRKAFSDRSVDLFNRFPGFDWDDSFEALHRYYPKRVAASYDSTSSIMTLRVSAFKAQDARAINETLLAMSEELVNQLNQRALADSIRFAAGIVQEAETKAKDAALALSTFRSRQSVFDPEKQSALQLQSVNRLQEELIANRAQLDQIRSLTPDNPQIPVLAGRIATLERVIDTEMKKVAGGSSSLTTQASDYERLALERTFADRQLASALTSLELARNDAQKQQLYLERIVQPNLPDYAVEPRRVRSIFVVLVLGLVAWGTLALLISSIREHKE